MTQKAREVTGSRGLSHCTTLMEDATQIISDTGDSQNLCPKIGWLCARLSILHSMKCVKGFQALQFLNLILNAKELATENRSHILSHRTESQSHPP